MSTTALHIIQLVKSLPDADQRAICEALLDRARTALGPRPSRRLQRLADGTYVNPDGIPNDDPIFKTLEEIEAARRRTPGRPAPEFD